MRPMELTDAQRRLYALARDRMVLQCPGWTDEYPGDPASAALELAVLLTDLQAERLEEVGDRDFLAFTKLLGGTPRRRRPAHLLARVVERGGLRAGRRFWLDGVPFEVAHPGKNAGEVSGVRLQAGGTWTAWDPRSPLTFSEGAGALELTFSAPLPAGERLRLWCGVLPEAGRTPPSVTLDPPVTLRAALPDGQPVRLLDGTCGLLKAGFWAFTLPAPAEALTVALEGPPEGRPRIAGFALEPALLVQRRTRSAAADLPPPFRLPAGWEKDRVLRFFLPNGEGWREAPELSLRDGCVSGWRGEPPRTVRVMAAEPDFRCSFSLREIGEERITLEEDGILPQSLRLMAEEDGIFYDCPLRTPDPARTLPRGCRWEADTQTLRFGDGRDFRLPKCGQLLIAGCACTLGASGNGAGGSWTEDGAALEALAPSSGGQDRETPEAAFFRTAREQSAPLRAVTAADYEAFAKAAPGLSLAKVRAVVKEGAPGVTVLAQPRSGRPLPALTPWETARLASWLDLCRLVGVPVTVRSPRYVPVDVSVFLRTSGRADLAALRAAALKLTDGASGPLGFGAALSHGALFAALGAVPGVQAVETLELSVDGGPPRRDGAVRLEPEALPYLREFQVREA